MKATTIMCLTRDEVMRKIPYAPICEMRFGATWDSRKCKKYWNENFTDEEKSSAEALFRQARKWNLESGVPDEVTMSTRTLMLWFKLAELCANV